MIGDHESTDQKRRPRGFPPAVSRGWAVYGLVILAFTVLLNSMDQLVLPAVVSGVQAEFKLTDTQVGSLLGAFVVFLALGAVPIGFVADRVQRKIVVAAGVAVWSLATMGSGLAGGFGQMFLARSIVGVGEASSQPAGTALVADWFGPGARARAMSVLIACAGLGVGVGLIVGGIVGNTMGWRAAFYVAGVPGLIVACLALTIREPARGATEPAGAPVRPPQAVLRDMSTLMRNPTFVLVLVAGTFGLFSQGTSQLVTLYLHRRFGLDMRAASSLPGTPLLVGGVLGTPLFGWIIDRRCRRSPAGAVEVAVAASFVAAVAAAVMFAAPSVAVFSAGVWVFGIVQWAFILAPFVIVQSVVAPHLRATAIGVTVTAGRLVGSALGPFVVGVLSDAFGGDLGRSLLVLSPPAMALSGLILVPALRTIGRDTRAMSEAWTAAGGDRPGATPALAESAV